MVKSLMLPAYLPVIKKEAKALVASDIQSLGHEVLVGCLAAGHMCMIVKCGREQYNNILF